MMKKQLLIVIVVCVLFLASSCMNQRREIVLNKGNELKIITQEYEFYIKANSYYKRTFKWGKCSKTMKLWPRKERWNGSFGIYHPGFEYISSGKCEGISKIVVEEGLLNFETKDELIAWIGKQNWLKIYYNNTGLFFGFIKSSEREQMNISLHQLLIKGKKPKSIEGANDNQFVYIEK